MLMPAHEIMSSSQTGLTPRRAGVIASVGLLHVAAVYALVTGMAGQIVNLAPRDLMIDTLESSAPVKAVAAPPQPELTRPEDTSIPDVTPPDFTIADSSDHSITVNARSHSQSAADSGASALFNTHTTPPYPADARILSHQGTVILELTVSPKGDVVAANILRSSGFAELDGAAVSWVLAHWKYRPAIQGGAAVTSQTQAAVKFDLKDAHG